MPRTASSGGPSWWPDLATLDDSERADLLARMDGALGPLRLRYCPLEPMPKQEAFLRLTGREAFYGGAAGPGKSTALLMAALQYVDVPGYAAILFRRTYPELKMPGGLIETSQEWLAPTGARWNSNESMWTFPSGAKLLFGHMQHEADRFNYHSAEFQFAGFDETTTFTMLQYRYLFSRVRRPQVSLRGSAPDGVTLDMVPLRVRGASNPGGPGHAWVYSRFVDPETRRKGVAFLRALMDENIYLDRESYEEMLLELPEAERLRLRHGDWEAIDPGETFRRERFEVVTEPLPKSAPRYRVWDLAASEPTAANPDPDYTAGVLVAFQYEPPRYRIEHIIRERVGPGEVEKLIKQTAEGDGHSVHIHLEQEPGSSGKTVVDLYKRMLTGYVVSSERPSGDKTVRARPAAAAVDNGQVEIVKGPHMTDFLDEAGAFPFGGHDDMVDAFSSAVIKLRPKRKAKISRPRGRVA